jgi:hypothetical protein
LLSTQSALGKPIVNVGSTINKWIFGASVLIRLTGRVMFITILALLGVQWWHIMTGNSIPIEAAVSLVTQNRLYQIIILGAFIINMRHILLRIREPEA